MKYEFKIRLFGTLYEMTIGIKITKRLPKFATVKTSTNWIYKGHRFKVDGVYMEQSQFDDPNTGRHLKISLLGTEFEKSKGYKYTVIPEKDLILEF